MDSIMEFLQGIFGEGFDLAAIASGAGLFGGGASAALAWMVSGAIMKFFLRTILTAVLTGGGFLFMLHYLGFQIVPPENLQNSFPFGQNYEAVGEANTNSKTAKDDSDKSCQITFKRLNKR